jgi:hypothetical protein
MRSTLIGALIGLFLLPAAGFAQSAPQTAALDSAAAPPPATAPATSGGLTRDQFIQRAKDRAGQRAAARFDQMDANHDGVLDRAEMGAWRSAHPRRSRNQPEPPAQQ